MFVLSLTERVIGALSQGKVIRTVVANVLRLLAAAILLAGIYGIIELLKVSFRLPTQGTIGGLIATITFAAAIFASSQIIFLRADTVRDLGDSQYTVMPILTILLRAAGEVYAVFTALTGLGGCAFIWLSGISPAGILPGAGAVSPFSGGGGTFLDGLIFLIALALFGFAGLVFFYFLAEVIGVLHEMARDVRSLAKNSIPAAAPSTVAR